MQLVLTALATAAAINIPRACVAPHDKYPFCDSSKDVKTRVSDLISRLTLDEKPTLLIARESPKGNISRLGVPEYDWGANCIHGVQSRCFKDRCPTSYPNPNTLGAAFNRSIWKSMGAVIGIELRALWVQGVGENHDSGLPHLGLDCWSPNIGIVRDPRWGRNLETPSEDPLVCGSFGSDVTTGLQHGEQRDERFLQAIVTLKHFDANSLEGDWGPKGTITRHTVDANISQYDLFSTYLPAFKQSVLEGDAKGVMCSYNSVNGVPSCANDWLLGTVLRDTWNFSGYVTSDSGAVVDIKESHHYTKDWPTTVAKAIKAGCDVESAPWPRDHPWGTGGPYIQHLPDAVRAGLLPETVIDTALKRTLGLRFELGLFDPIEDQPYWHVPPTEIASPAHLALALDATRQGLVLLQNPKVLPLTAGGKVAVVGPHTNDRSSILGNYLGQICPESFGSRVCVPTVYEEVRALNLRAGAAPQDTVNASGLSSVTSTDPSGIVTAVDAAKAADTIVYVGGLDTHNVEREGKDRHNISLPGLQSTLLHELAALRKPMVIVLFHGGMVTLSPDLLAMPNVAIVSAGYPGIHGGQALAEALFTSPKTGPAVNRWGRTPITWYSEAGWKAAAFDMLDFNMAKAPGRTHRYTSAGVQWPFGFGLSYSEHTYTIAQTGGAVTVDVSNAGAPGDAVVLVFMRPSPKAPPIPADEPASHLKQWLIHFARVDAIAQGAKASVTFDLTPAHVTLVDAHGHDVIYPGCYEISAMDGKTSVEIACTADGTCGGKCS